MYPMAEFLREKRLRWFGHVQRRDYDETTRIILQVVVDGKQNRGRPKLMARPGERGYGQKPDDDWDGRRQKTLACHHSSRHTTKCRGGKVRK